MARLLNDNNEFIDISGTPGYMAPEVINNLHQSFTADYFSIGVIMYEFILGKVFRFIY